MRFERLLTSVHALHQTARASRTTVLVRTLLRPPPRHEPVLRSTQAVLQPCVLELLALVFLFPTLPFGGAPFSIPVIAVAIHARAIIRCRIEVDDRLGDVGQERSIVTDDDDTATARFELCGQEIEPTAVEMIGGLVEQEKVVIGTEKARQSHPVPLTHREICEKSVHVSLRFERSERDLNATLGIPCIDCFGML